MQRASEENVVHLSVVVQEDLSDKVRFEQRPEWSREVKHEVI